jgi:NADPH:quinone reductase-like Zn-dependent oxidoreductase
MHAAVVRAFDHPPRYETVDPPVAAADEILVDVLATGLHPRVRSGASGDHYADGDTLPLIPGIDGVGRHPDGTRGYFLTLDPIHGSLADQVVVPRRRWIPLPDDADEIAVAAGVNPAMSSWLPLRHRVDLRPGQTVLVVGATGSAGRMAVQIARQLGAGRVIAAGRDPKRRAALTALGADAAVPLNADAVRAEAADVDVVVDYLWGEPAAAVLAGVLAARTDPGRPLTWLHIGAVAGPTLELPSAALRAHNLTIQGSGQGSMSTADMAAGLPAIVDTLAAGTITVDATAVPLRDVETTWTDPISTTSRVVFRP